ncbi:hypothetical protein F4820DRAFT_394383 [Hypoxylon rubiginosum]|uniref:Uncharacterized protein n=1 Tax=Hypoxylon rubiginosum TaxID=110542 RepID=A0ACB9YVD2_9PEZI|nr:hypothetical protein F4820DRAFT_394383 [Hypoxylon rubiginosum]
MASHGSVVSCRFGSCSVCGRVWACVGVCGRVGEPHPFSRQPCGRHLICSYQKNLPAPTRFAFVGRPPSSTCVLHLRLRRRRRTQQKGDHHGWAIDESRQVNAGPFISYQDPEICRPGVLVYSYTAHCFSTRPTNPKLFQGPHSYLDMGLGSNTMRIQHQRSVGAIRFVDLASSWTIPV